MGGRLSRALIVGSAALMLWTLVMGARSYWPFTVDDTFITMRYAKHLAEGLGPSWNPRGSAVEGYTTALWMALLALPHAFGSDALVFAKVAGIVAAFGCMVVAAALAYELTRTCDVRARRLATLTPFAFGAAYWPLALHAISGMETTLSALLLTLFALVSLRFARRSTALRARSLCVLALLSILARPEAGFACAATLLTELLLVPRDQRALLVRAAALYLVLPGALYFGVRYAYFGLAFPLSFYVKAQGQARFAGLDEVRRFFAPLIWEHPALGLLALVGLMRARSFLPALAGLLAFALFFVFPAHVMGFEGRYLFPLFPSFAALVGAGVGKLAAGLFVEFERVLPKASRWLEPALAIACWALFASISLPAHEPASRARWLDYGAGLERAHIALAKELRKTRLSVVQPTIALLDVGAVAYYSEWFTIDTFGLNDRRVALSRRTDVPYVFSYRPELVVVVSAEANHYVEVFDWEPPLYASALARGYQAVCSYRFLDDYHLLVLARAGSPLRDTLACPRI